LSIKIKKAGVKKENTISITYGNDISCLHCKYILFVRNEKKRKLRITESNKFKDKLSFKLADLIEFGEKNKSGRYDFYYWKRSSNGKNTPMKLLFQMTLQ